MQENFISDFKLSITKALADQLAEVLDSLVAAPFTAANVTRIAERPGIYELFEKNGPSLEPTRVYVGKAKSDLRKRLSQHFLKLLGRENLLSDSILFKIVYVDEDLDAAAPERMLIDRYRNESSVPWNTNGFGNKDPGRNRDRTLVKSDHFDALYPINLMYRPAQWAMHQTDTPTVSSSLELLKKATPFNIRFENHQDLRRPLLPFREAPVTVADWLEAVIHSLPEGWQATALPGYVIIYKETADYASATGYWYKSGGVVLSHSSKPSFNDDEGAGLA